MIDSTCGTREWLGECDGLSTGVRQSDGVAAGRLPGDVLVHTALGSIDWVQKPKENAFVVFTGDGSKSQSKPLATTGYAQITDVCY